MKYFCIINESFPSEFYEENSLIFKVLRKNYFFKSKCKIVDASDQEILVFTSVNFFFYSKIKIIKQDLDKLFLIRQEKSHIVVNDSIISIKAKTKIFGKYEAICIKNNRAIGKINEEYKFPNSQYTFTFEKNDELNFYCLILFAMFSVGFADAA